MSAITHRHIDPDGDVLRIEEHDEYCVRISGSRASACEHTAAAVQAERERAIEAIKIRREHRIAPGDHLGHLSGLYEAIRMLQELNELEADRD